MSVDVVTLGHMLTDIRLLVDRFATPDSESEVLEISYGVGGSAVNTAVGAVSLGKSAAVIAKVGMDGFGRMNLEEVMRKGVDVNGVKIEIAGETGFTIIIVNHSTGEIVMYGYKGVSEELTPRELKREVISEAKWLHIASLRLDTSIAGAQIAKAHGVKVSWDPGRRLALSHDERVWEMLRYVDVVLVNLLEAREITGVEDYRRAAEKLREGGAKAAVVKLGSGGSYVVSDEGEERVPAFKVKATDTTGAGDAYAAGLITRMLEGAGIFEAARFASAVAALKVQKLGAQTIPSRGEVEEFLKVEAD